jgi:hypothetical protein
MKRRIAFLVVVAHLILVPSQAMAALCFSVCNQYAPCDRACQQYGGGPTTTCGAWGDCQGPCQPNYQPVSSTQIGAYSINYFSPNSCDHVVVKRVTWHDSNCVGSVDYTTCFSTVDGSRNDHFCCSFFFCGGQITC